MASPHIVEIERKYDVDETAIVPALQDLPGVGRVEKPAEHHLTAEYFDTEDLRLTSRGITLRRRMGGHDAGWHLKLPSGTDERLEFHEPAGQKKDGVPAPLLSLVRVHVRDRPLVPVARLRTRRIVYRLRGADDQSLAEMSDDQVQAETFFPEAAGRVWREWEVELTGGSGTLLDAAQDQLAAAGARASAHHSKLERAIDRPLSAAVQEQPLPGRKGPASDVLLAYLREQVHVLKTQDPLVRQDAADSVHGMRVATRRLRSALATHRQLLDADPVSFLRDELKWLAGVLGAARDAEVMRGRLTDMIAREPEDLVMGPVLRRVGLDLGASYGTAHAALLEALDEERYFLLLDALDALLAAPPLTGYAARRRTR